MKLQSSLRKVALLAFMLVMMCARAGYAQPQDYSFKVHNVGKNTITKIMASEDGKKWGYFDIGDGIEPGETRTIVWSNATNNQSCSQYFKAAFDDGEESPPKKFDFCDKNLAIDIR